MLEGNVWGIPKTAWVARFQSTEEAERVTLAAGFRFVPEEKGFRAEDKGPTGDIPHRIGGSAGRFGV